MLFRSTMIICGGWQARRASPARTPDPPWRTRRETQNVRNVGQMETWGKSDAVNKRRGDFCRDTVWLPKRCDFQPVLLKFLNHSAVGIMSPPWTRFELSSQVRPEVLTGTNCGSSFHLKHLGNAQGERGPVRRQNGPVFCAATESTASRKMR